MIHLILKNLIKKNVPELVKLESSHWTQVFFLCVCFLCANLSLDRVLVVELKSPFLRLKNFVSNSLK